MKINRTSEQLNQINALKNLRSITFKDLYKTNEDRFLVQPGFIVGTESGFMYLTIRDEYFEDFARRIRELYDEEKDFIYETGVLGDKKLESDPFTRGLLENGTLEETSDMYDFYKNKCPYSESLLFEEDVLSSFKGIIIHHIKESMKLFNETLTDIKVSGGSNGVYYITCKVNNTPKILPLYFEKKDEDTYHITIGNLFEKAIPLNMEIMFTKDGIVVSNTVSEYNLSDYTKYEFIEKGTVERDVSLDGKLVSYHKEDLKQTSEVPINLASIDNDYKVSTWYSLPWSAYYGLDIKDKCIENDGTLSDNEGVNRMLSKRCIYLAQEDNNFFIKESFSKRYRKKSQRREDNVEVVFDNLEKQIIGLRQENGYLLETSFYGNAVTGFYKTNLLGNHFYHVSHIKDVSALNKSSVKGIDKEAGLEENVDLIDIKKYIK